MVKEHSEIITISNVLYLWMPASGGRQFCEKRRLKKIIHSKETNTESWFLVKDAWYCGTEIALRIFGELVHLYTFDDFLMFVVILLNCSNHNPARTGMQSTFRIAAQSPRIIYLMKAITLLPSSLRRSKQSKRQSISFISLIL